MLNPIACMTSGYRGCGLERVLEGIAKAGFQYVELIADPVRVAPEAMSANKLQELRNALSNSGLMPISVAGHTDLIAPDGVEKFKRRLELAAMIGARVVNTGSGHTENKEEEERFFAVMPDIIKLAERSGLIIAFETHGGLTGTGVDCQHTLARLGSPLCKVNYDTANVIYYRGVRPETDINDIADQVSHVHLKDKIGGQMVYNFPELGRGTVDFPVIVSALEKSGYLGPFSIEIEIEGERDPEAEDALRVRLYQYTARLLGQM